MKTLLLIAMLSTLASCVSEEKSSSRSCTFNGAPIECSSLSVGKSKDLIVKAQLTSEIIVHENEIEFLEDKEDRQEKIVNGSTYQCVAFSNLLMDTYEIVGNKLILSYTSYNNDKEEVITQTFTRAKGSGKTLKGTWIQTNQETDSDGFYNLTLEFTETSMKQSVECHYRS